MTRSLPDIARTRSADIQRHAELVALARNGGATTDDLRTLSALDADLHRFDRMCRRWAPLSATELGFTWGETLVNETDPSVTVVVREGALVSFEGGDMTLAEVCSRLASRGMRVSLGGWNGSAGNVADLAGLRHGAGSDMREAVAEEPVDDRGADEPPAQAAQADTGGAKRAKTAKTGKEPGPGSNYDLFG